MRQFFLCFIFTFNCSLLTSFAQKASFAQTTINVGSTLWHKPVSATFKFKNKDRVPLRIEAVDAGCGCLQPTWTQRTLEKGEEGSITVTYDANLLGHFDRIILVKTNANEEPMRLRMKGVVSTGERRTAAELYPARIGDIGLSTNYVEFSDVHRGDSATARIEIWNDSKEVFTPQLMHLPSYVTAVYKPEMLARGRRGFIDLTLHSDGLHNDGLNQTSVYLARYSGDKVGSENEIVLSSVLLPDASAFASELNRPSLHLSTQELNLGRLGKKSKLKGRVAISNTGSGILRISAVHVFNNAIQVSMPKRDIVPGETITMDIVLLAKYLKTAKSLPRVLLITNDSEHVKETIDVVYE
ncbi:MAG: DUF1573 domain-containing protein [Bacteroidaceae bacterium]|nr:DUF1573 domain-containing protein [Bacteroidaceae bacterium]